MRNRILVAVLALALVLGAYAGVSRAQNVYTGGYQSYVTYSGTVAQTSVSVISATTSKVTKILSLDVSSSGAGVVVLQSSANGATLAQFYVAANTPVKIDETVLGNALRSTSGGAIYAYLSTGSVTLTLSARCQIE